MASGLLPDLFQHTVRQRSGNPIERLWQRAVALQHLLRDCTSLGPVEAEVLGGENHLHEMPEVPSVNSCVSHCSNAYPQVNEPIPTVVVKRENGLRTFSNTGWPNEHSRTLLRSPTVERFDVEIERRGHYVIVRPVGDLDLAVVDVVEQTLSPLENEFSEVVIDLRAVEFLDSTGLRAILSADARSRSNGFNLRIIKGGDQVQRLLSHTGMDKHLSLIDASELPETG